MEKNVYTLAGLAFKIMGLVVGFLVFLTNSFDFSSNDVGHMGLVFFFGLILSISIASIIFFIGKYIETNGENFPLNYVSIWPKPLERMGLISLFILILYFIFSIFVYLNGSGVSYERIINIIFISPVAIFPMLLFFCAFV